MPGKKNDHAKKASARASVGSIQLSELEKAVAPTVLELPQQKISDFCRRHHIRKLAVFGSILRPDFRPDSDIDVLVEFEPGSIPGLAFFTMQEELSALPGRRVDLNTPECLSRYYRDQILHEAQALYVSA